MRLQTLKKLQERNLNEGDSRTFGIGSSGARAFEEWLISPSLYPTDERILSKEVEELRIEGFDGRVLQLEAETSLYKFYCPREGFLRSEWPRLKHQLLQQSRVNAAAIKGVRFLRTVGELPIWLDNGPKMLKLTTKLPRNAEIACFVERKVSCSQSIDAVLEAGISQGELQELAEFICSLPAATVTYSETSGISSVSTNLLSDLLPYFMVLRSELEGLSFHDLFKSSPRLSRKTYVDGSSEWSLDEPISREELFFTIRQIYGAGFATALLKRFPEKLCRKSVALIGFALVERYNQSSHAAELLKSALCELFVGASLQQLAVIVISKSPALAQELSSILQTELVSLDTEAEEIYLSGSVIHTVTPNGLLLLEIQQELRKMGKQSILVQEGGVDFGALIEVSPVLSPQDQAVQVLKGISSLLPQGV